MHVEFINIDDQAQEQPAGKAFMKDGQVVFEEVSPIIELELRRYGVFHELGKIYIDAGEEFLKALPIQYTGSRFRAKLVNQ